MNDEEIKIPSVLHFSLKISKRMIPEMIDTESNVNCIAQELVKNEKIISAGNVYLIGANNTPLSIISKADTEFEINKFIFKLNAFVIKNLLI